MTMNELLLAAEKWGLFEGLGTKILFAFGTAAVVWIGVLWKRARTRRRPPPLAESPTIVPRETSHEVAPAIVPLKSLFEDDREEPSEPVLASPNEPGLLQLTPVEILRAIQAEEAPMMRPVKARSYRGNIVDWNLVYSNGSPRGTECTIFAIEKSRCIDAYVIFDVPLDEHPLLKRLPEKTIINVRGRISRVDGSIELEDAALRVSYPHTTPDRQTISPLTPSPIGSRQQLRA